MNTNRYSPVKRSALAIALSGLLALSMATPQIKAKPMGAVRLPALLTTSRPTLEKMLGASTGPDTEPQNGLVSRDYALSGTKGLRVYYGRSGSSDSYTIPGPFNVSFPKGTTWKQAATILGLKPAKLRIKPMDNIPAMGQISGHAFKNWNLYFSGAGAKYPGDAGLINNPSGLPLFTFEPKSINE